MFCFCCPSKNLKNRKNGIDEKLIEVNQGNSIRTVNQGTSIRTANESLTNRLVMSESDKKIYSFSFESKSIKSSHLQGGDYNNLKQLSSLIHNDQSLIQSDRPLIRSNNHAIITNNIPSLGIQPRFQQPLLTKNKSELQQFEHNTEIIYFDTKKEDEFCLRYLLNKKPNMERQAKSILNCVLSRKSSDHPQRYQLVLIIPSKLIYQTKHLHIPPHIHPIFTNMRRPQKNPSTINSTQIVQILEAHCSFIKTQSFDKIIVILQGQQDPKYIKNYCTQLCKRFSLQEFIKIWWVFPSFLGIEDLSDILKQSLRKFLISEKIQQAAKYLLYEIELVKQLNLEGFLIVKNKRWRQASQSKWNNSKSNKLSFPRPASIPNQEQSSQVSPATLNYETQLCLAMGLLMVEMNENVMPFYKYFLQNALQEMKFIDYMKYKALLQNEKENFFKKLLYYNLLTEEGCKVLEDNNKIIEHKYHNPDHRSFTIKHSVKKKFIAAFGFQDSVQTGQNSTPVQHQWDDQLTLELQDLKTRKCSWDKQEEENDQSDLNLIDEQEIQKIVIQDFMFESDLREKDVETLENNIQQNIGHSKILDKSQENNEKVNENQELRIEIVENIQQ